MLMFKKLTPTEMVDRGILPQQAIETEMPKVPVPRTIVSGVVVRLHGLYLTLDERRATLTSDIERMSEELRQTNLALETLGASLLAMSDDPSLTDHEKVMSSVGMAIELDEKDML